MCGVAGIFAYHPSAAGIDRQELRSIRDHMAARGPDGSGEWFSADGRAALGHRRLSIIDLSERGAQPMASADGQLVISFNGEIYNYRELRNELERRGRVFHSDSDTEVLLQLYAEHGHAMLARLRGMFAFALWDARKQAMLLARDTFGIKPLYYSTDQGTLRFASQVKALLAGGMVDTSPEPAGHAGFYLWGSVPAPWTLYRGVKALPAGHFAWVGTQGPSEPEAFCRVQDLLADAAAHPARGTVDDALDAIAAAVRDSVAAHHVSDVPVAIFLSAGMDSAMIAAVSAQQGAHAQSVTLAFKEYQGTGDDEAPMAEQLAAICGTRHSTVSVSRTDFERHTRKLLASMDQPSIDGVNSWFVAHAARSQGVKVALSGLGGDELFASYPSFRDLPRIRRLTRPLARWPGIGRNLRVLAAPLLPKALSPKYASLLEYGTTFAGAYLLRRGLHMPWELPSVMDPELARQGWADLRCRAQLESTANGIPLDRLAVSALEMSWYTRHQLLPDTDWASMAHSVEVRVPFLDVPLLRAAAPWLAAFPELTKRQIAERLAPELPASILSRHKSGFSVPVRQWLNPQLSAKPTRGLRAWSGSVYRSFAVPHAPLVEISLPPSLASAALWSPEMATRGGIQNYMWRLWEMLASAKCASQPPKGLSLMDTPQALAAWASRVEARPRGAGQGKLRFTRWALTEPGRAKSVIVGHVHHAPVAWLARLVGNIDNYLVVLHGIEAWKRLSLLQRVALRSAYAVVATTHFTARKCAQANRVPDGNFRVIPLCADPHPAAPDTSLVLAGDFPVMFVGRLAGSEKYKGLETLIEAVGQLLAGNIGVTLHVIGDGDDRARLERFANASGLGDNVVFHGSVDDAQLQSAYASAKVFAMPSAKEGFGIVFLEAMRRGVACIGGAHGGTPEVFDDGTEGLLVPYGDIQALAGQLERLATDPELRVRLGQAGQQRFEKEYSFERFSARWEGLLAASLLPAPRAPRSTREHFAF